MGVVAVTASGNEGHIELLAQISFLPGDLLTEDEVEEIVKIGKTVHFRHYVGLITILLFIDINNLAERGHGEGLSITESPRWYCLSHDTRDSETLLLDYYESARFYISY